MSINQPHHDVLQKEQAKAPNCCQHCTRDTDEIFDGLCYDCMLPAGCLQSLLLAIAGEPTNRSLIEQFKSRAGIEDEQEIHHLIKQVQQEKESIHHHCEHCGKHTKELFDGLCNFCMTQDQFPDELCPTCLGRHRWAAGDSDDNICGCPSPDDDRFSEPTEHYYPVCTKCKKITGGTSQKMISVQFAAVL